MDCLEAQMDSSLWRVFSSYSGRSFDGDSERRGSFWFSFSSQGEAGRMLLLLWIQVSIWGRQLLLELYYRQSPGIDGYPLLYSITRLFMRATESKCTYLSPPPSTLQPTPNPNTSSLKFQFSPRPNLPRKKSSDSSNIIQNESHKKLLSPAFFKNTNTSRSDKKTLGTLQFTKTLKSPSMKYPGEVKRALSSLNLPGNLRHTIDSVSDDYRIKPLSKEKRLSIEAGEIIGQNLKVTQQNEVLKRENTRLKGIVHKLIEGEGEGQTVPEHRPEEKSSLQRLKTPPKVFSNNIRSRKLNQSYERQAGDTETITKIIKEIFSDFRRIRNFDIIDSPSPPVLSNQLQQIKVFANSLITSNFDLKSSNHQTQQQILHYRNKAQSDKAIKESLLQQISTLKQKVNSEHKQKQELVVTINELKLENQSSSNRIKQLQSQILFYQGQFKGFRQDLSECHSSQSLFKFNLQSIPLVKQRPRKNSVQQIEKIMSQMQESQSFIENDPVESVRSSYERKIEGIREEYQGEIWKLRKEVRELKESSRACSTMDSGMEKSMIFKDLWKRKDEEYENMRALIVKLRGLRPPEMVVSV